MTIDGAAEVTDAFLRAIDLEIEAILTGSATDAISLRQGIRTGKDGNDFEYVFLTGSKPNVVRRSLVRSSTKRGRWERAAAVVLPCCRRASATASERTSKGSPTPCTGSKAVSAGLSSLTLLRAQATNPGRFYEETGLSSQTCRLLNVMLSRAQDHLVVVADVNFLSAHVAPDSEVARMLAYLGRRASRLSVDELIPVRAADDLAGLTEDDLARPAFFPADEVPRAASWDIARARESVDVYCAFLDPQPVRKWLRQFAAPIAAGVRVTVYTRPHEPSSPPAALVQELLAAGCQVETRERMHEKVMIVDDTVLWHGSLNLLANIGPTDLMMRFTDPTACARVQRIMSVARMERAARTWNAAARPVPAGSGGVRPGEVVDGRLYLNVSFAEKDEAKRLAAAQWDRRRQLWHVAAETPRERVARWLPSAQ